jgi:hypothetical protein
MRYTVNISDIEDALISLGGEAKTWDIQDEVLRVHCSGGVPENYKDKRTFRQTIQRKIEEHCPEAAGFDNKEGTEIHTRLSRVVSPCGRLESERIHGHRGD